MGNKEMKLPDSKQVEFLSKSYHPKEWVMDPPSFVWWKIRDDVQANLIEKRPMSPQTKSNLISFYKSDIIKLEKLIQRDLSEWLK